MDHSNREKLNRPKPWARRNARLLTVVALWGTTWLLLAAAAANRAPGREDRAYAGVSARHWLGCEQIGDDLAAYLLDAVGRSLAVAAMVAVPSVALAYVVGCLWALYEQRPEAARRESVLRVITLSFLGPTPLLLTMSILFCFRDPDAIAPLALAMVAVAWPPLALRVRNEANRLLKEPWIVQARHEGAGTWDLLTRELPGMAAPMLESLLVLAVVFAVSTEATLGYLSASTDSRSLGKLLEMSRDAFEQGDPPVVQALRLIAAVAFVLGVIIGGMKGLQTWCNDQRVARCLADDDGYRVRAATVPVGVPAYRVSVAHRGTGLLVVRDAFVTARPGVITVVSGPSGGGKTMTAGAMAGLLTPEMRGRVERLGGAPAEGIVLLPQGLQENFGAYLTLGDYLTHVGLTGPALEVALGAMGLELGQLQDAGGRWKTGRELPGGVAMRLGLALVLHTRRPRVLVVDEPVAPLDDGNARRVGDALDRLVRAHPEIAVIVINHRPRFSRQFASDLVFLADGVTAWAGRADEFFALEPGTTGVQAIDDYLCAVARLLGSRSGIASETDADGGEAKPDDLAEPAATPAVVVDDLAVRYPDEPRPVLEGLSFHVGPGRGLVLPWKSGAGKSTVLRVLHGTLPPDSGKVGVLGETPDPRSAGQRRRVRYCGQSPALLLNPTVPVRRILRRAAARLGLDGDLDALIRTACAHAHFPSSALDKRPVELSGGLRARAGLARCLLGDVEILLADEPFANLDPETALSVVDRLADLLRVGRLSLVLAAHDPDITRGFGPLLKSVALPDTRTSGSRNQAVTSVL